MLYLSNSSNSNSNGNSISFNIDACNSALQRDGLKAQMFDVSNIPINDVNVEGFWNHHTHYDESTYFSAMSDYASMMNEYASGMSIDQCYERYPSTASLIFGRDTIRISESLSAHNNRIVIF